jgi:putative transposase
VDVPNNMDANESLRKHPDDNGFNLLCDMVKVFAEHLMDAEVDTLCNASCGEVTPDRTNSRNGHRRREFDPRVGTIDLGIPKLRHDSYHPGWV